MAAHIRILGMLLFVVLSIAPAKAGEICVDLRVTPPGGGQPVGGRPCLPSLFNQRMTVRHCQGVPPTSVVVCVTADIDLP